MNQLGFRERFAFGEYCHGVSDRSWPRRQGEMFRDACILSRVLVAGKWNDIFGDCAQFPFPNTNNLIACLYH